MSDRHWPPGSLPEGVEELRAERDLNQNLADGLRAESKACSDVDEWERLTNRAEECEEVAEELNSQIVELFKPRLRVLGILRD